MSDKISNLFMDAETGCGVDLKDHDTYILVSPWGDIFLPLPGVMPKENILGFKLEGAGSQQMLVFDYQSPSGKRTFTVGHITDTPSAVAWVNRVNIHYCLELKAEEPHQG